MDNNEIGFGKNISGVLTAFPFRRPAALSEGERKNKILNNNKDGNFRVMPNDKADGSRPFYAIESYSEVKRHTKKIEEEASRANVNPNLVKAIIHVETTQGAIDRLPAAFDINKSIRPMNIHADYWRDLGYSREDLKNPDKNIEAGVKLLKRIKQNMPYAPDEEIASVYNSLDARYVTDYGMRVKKVMQERPWE